MVTPSIRFLYHCKGVQHVQWIIYIRARQQANIKSKIYWEICLRLNFLLIITSQCTHVQHNKMICSVQTLVCMVNVTGHDNNSLNIHNHRPIKKVSTMANRCIAYVQGGGHMSFLLLKICCQIIICKAFDRLLNLSTKHKCPP